MTSIEPENKATPTQIFSINDSVTSDIEGMAVYQNAQNSWLVVSSQGNNSYALFEANKPYGYLGSFNVSADYSAKIDGSSETDGLDVTSMDLGGEYQQGLLVVQDGRNVMPVQPQNFKYVPFSRIIDALNLSL